MYILRVCILRFGETFGREQNKQPVQAIQYPQNYTPFGFLKIPITHSKYCIL